MPIDVQEYEKLKRAAQKAQSDVDRAKGQLDAAKQRLKNEFGCKNLRDAKAKAKELAALADAAEADYDTAKAQFEQEWADDDGE